MLLRLAVVAIVLVAHAVAYFATVAGLLAGLVSCVLIYRTWPTPIGLGLALASFVVGAALGHVTSRWLPQLVEDPEAILDRLQSLRRRG